ncbi:hypothetical protein [Mycobacteroides abscessus]|uniref:hypothetical protein n=1 Tax=Mycobacteroides abscessus TaxID=36809 RepID=UPI0011C3D5E3|nr:hypothetical protein [Mycobacteroides abscessus]
MVVDVAELAFNPEYVEDVVDTDAYHREQAVVPEGRELFLVCEFGRNRRLYLIGRNGLRAASMAASLMYIDPSPSSAFVHG